MECHSPEGSPSRGSGDMPDSQLGRGSATVVRCDASTCVAAQPAMSSVQVQHAIEQHANVNVNVMLMLMHCFMGGVPCLS